jgi:hypothetical protein
MNDVEDDTIGVWVDWLIWLVGWDKAKGEGKIVIVIVWIELLFISASLLPLH